jgi:hypothetical protein
MGNSEGSRRMRGSRGRLIRGWVGVAAAWVVLSVVASGAVASEYLRSFGPDGLSSSSFAAAGSVGVDQESGNIYVLDIPELPSATEECGSPPCFEGKLYKFDENGKPVAFGGSAPYLSGNELTGLDVPSCRGCTQVAADATSHDVYVTSGNSVTAFEADGDPAEFSAGPGAGTNRISGFGRLSGLAVDENGMIYAGDLSSGAIYIYDHSGEEVLSFAAAEVQNIAVDGSGDVYASRSFTNGVLKYIASEFPVSSGTTFSPDSEVLDPNISASVAVDPATQDVFVAEVGPEPRVKPRIAKYDDEGNLVTTFAGPEEEGEVLGPVGIGVFGEASRVYVSDDSSQRPSQVEIFGFEPGQPTIRATSVTDVTSNSATLRGVVNPNSFDTSYQFEYGLQDCGVGSCASVPLITGDLGNGREGVGVAQAIAGLESGTTYHFRLIASNSEGTTVSPDGTFITQEGGLGSQLADNRAWEMVSPPDKHGALLQGSASGLVQAASDGQAVSYPSIGSIEASPEGSRPFEPASVLARRSAEGRWESKDITPRNDVVEGLPVGNEGQYKIFSSDLARAALEPASPTELSTEGALESPYLRDNTEPPTFTSLVRAALVPAKSDPNSRPKIAAATTDLWHIGLKSVLPLVEGAPGVGASLYLWSAGEVHPVSVLPEGGIVSGGASDLKFGSTGTVSHAISDDGSRVFWSWTNSGSTGLYLRDTQAEETVRLDEVSGASGPGAETATFQGASADGTVIFFTDAQQLTGGASPSGEDLYRCEIPPGSSATGCASLIDVSAPIEGSGESAEVKTLVTGISENASTVYFVATGVLDTEPNQIGAQAVPGKANLYAWGQGQGVRFVATLSGRDNKDWGGDGFSAYHRSAATSPSGRYLAFASIRSLTGQKNVDPVSGESVVEVYLYDASADKLSCASCDPTGSAPVGSFPRDFSLVDPRRQWSEGSVAVAATIPEPSIYKDGFNTVFYAPRSVLDNGRVFFNVIGSLVPADSNQQWDVYQYEPLDVGSCGASSGDPSTVRSGDGCVSLISSGTGKEEAGFLDASASGDDAFFLAPDQLNEPDEDSEYDVYDARVNGTAETLASRVECSGAACQMPASPPSASTPGSSTFQGAGNVKQKGRHCRKGRHRARRHGRKVCVRASHKKQQRVAHQPKGGRR